MVCVLQSWIKILYLYEIIISNVFYETANGVFKYQDWFEIGNMPGRR